MWIVLTMRRLTENLWIGCELNCAFCWVGGYWQYRQDLHPRLDELHLWICLLPCIAIHLLYVRLKPGLEDWHVPQE